MAQHGGRGFAFAWDRSALRKQAEAAAIDIDEAQIWPETLMREPLDSGLRLVRGLDGTEAECWSEGQLLASRWWPQAPDATQWQAFVRGLGPAAPVGAERAEVPLVQDLSILTKPWLPVRALSDVEGGVSRSEVLGWRVVLLCCVALTAAVGHQLWSGYWRVDALRDELANAQAAAGGTIAARDRALQLMAESRQLSAVLSGVLPLELMQHLVQILPKEVVVK